MGFYEIKQLIKTTKVIPKDLEIYTFCPAFSSRVVITCNNDLALSQFKLDEISCLTQPTQIVSKTVDYVLSFDTSTRYSG